jgi:hypothetical protein
MNVAYPSISIYLNQTYALPIFHFRRNKFPSLAASNKRKHCNRTLRRLRLPLRRRVLAPVQTIRRIAFSLHFIRCLTFLTGSRRPHQLGFVATTRADRTPYQYDSHSPEITTPEREGKLPFPRQNELQPTTVASQDIRRPCGHLR